LIIEGIKQKKGEDIVVVNLHNIKNSPCALFVICSANSKSQINAIANNIEKLLIEKVNLKMWRQEGMQSNWRLLDYAELVIHIFKKETREVYKLQELWADGIIKKLN